MNERGGGDEKSREINVPWTVMPNAASRSNRSINPRHIFINVSEGCPRRASYPFSSPSRCPRSHARTHARTSETDRRGKGEGKVGGSWHPINTRVASSAATTTTISLTTTDGPPRRRDGRSPPLLVPTHHRHTRASSRAATRARARTLDIDMYRRWITGRTRRLLQPGRPSRPVRGRVCHCTGTTAAANIHSPSSPLVSVIDNAEAELNDSFDELSLL